MASAFAKRVISWQAEYGRRGLPWQATRDPYRIWLSEVMLQQTQVATVLPYFARFVASFPDVGSLARAPIDDVLAHWSGLGYYRRAHHLHEAARAVMDGHGGVFPRDAATLATLPGVGRSTAAAIAVFAAGERAAILDANVRRVLARHRANERGLWEIAESLLPEDGIEAYTQGLMDLGATVCLRTRPRCDACPVAQDCRGRIERRIGDFPARRPAKALPQRALRVLVIEHGGEVLFEKRPRSGVWGGLWSLPECALGEDPQAAVRARYGADVEVGATLPPIAHGFTHFALTLHPQRMRAARWPVLADGAGTVWLAPGEALAAALPAPIRKLVAAL
ncbi:MAG: A/G-specific adenine glycosylase [Burkholderiales bacterium]|nr:A/G-specific adenine glycosylase [Burkholderiales bacterium]